MTSRLSLRPLIAAGFVPLVAASLALSGCSNSTDESAPSFKGEGSGMTTVNNSDKEEETAEETTAAQETETCLLYTSPSPRDRQKSRMPSSA